MESLNQQKETSYTYYAQQKKQLRSYVQRDFVLVIDP